MYQKHIDIVSAQVVWPAGYDWHRNTAKPTKTISEAGLEKSHCPHYRIHLARKTNYFLRKGTGRVSVFLLWGQHEHKRTL